MTKAPRKRDERTDERSPAETERVRDAILKRMLNTPPKPKKGKGKGEAKPQKSRES